VRNGIERWRDGGDGGYVLDDVWMMLEPSGSRAA
jgi:hypothetical protein